MWSLKPYNSPPSTCPVCDYQNTGFSDYFFAGSQIFSNGDCVHCGTSYTHNWPIGHGKDFPISFSNEANRYPLKSEQWLARPMIKAVKEHQSLLPEVWREVRTKISQVMLLNCLDPCYGHILLKLFNCSFYENLKPSEGLVVIVPENCTWLIPDFVAEIWVVDISLSQINSQLDSLKPFIDKISPAFESVHLLPINTHPDHYKIDFYPYFKVNPFKLQEFTSKPFQVCLVWREDRWWVRTRVEQLLSLVAIKFSLKWLKNWFLRRQLNAMIQVANHLWKEMPEVTFKIAGLGSWGIFPKSMEDLRETKLTDKQESKWCKVYADSQVVVGVHGSSMLIPTALAAGFIELLPDHKIPFLSEDILMKHSPRFQIFLGRHLNLHTSPMVVARHISSMLADFPYLYKNTIQAP